MHLLILLKRDRNLYYSYKTYSFYAQSEKVLSHKTGKAAVPEMRQQISVIYLLKKKHVFIS